MTRCRPSTSRRAPRARRRLLSWSLSCLVALGSFAPSLALAESLQSLFEQGNAAFYAGDFAQAAERYEALLEAGVRDADLYFNLGTAYGRQGKLGLSVLHYERSLRLDPGADDTLRGLALAQEALGHRRADRQGEATVRTRPPLSEALVQPFSENQLALVTLLCCLGLFGALTVRRFARGDGLRLGLAVAVAVLGLMLSAAALGLGVRADWLADGRAGIILAEGAPLLEGPDPRAADRGRVPEGARVRLFEREAGFVRVRIGEELAGWLRDGQVAAIQD